MTVFLQSGLIAKIMPEKTKVGSVYMGDRSITTGCQHTAGWTLDGSRSVKPLPPLNLSAVWRFPFYNTDILFPAVLKIRQQEFLGVSAEFLSNPCIIPNRH